MDARISEIDPDRGAVPAVEGLVRLDRHRAAVDPAGDERMVAHELGRVDFADDLALARLRDLAILRADAGDRREAARPRVFVPKLPAGPEKRPSARSPSKKFIGGDPMKPATNRLAGALYIFAGVSSCCSTPFSSSATR